MATIIPTDTGSYESIEISTVIEAIGKFDPHFLLTEIARASVNIFNQQAGAANDPVSFSFSRIAILIIQSGMKSENQKQEISQGEWMTLVQMVNALDYEKFADEVSMHSWLIGSAHSQFPLQGVTIEYDVVKYAFIFKANIHSKLARSGLAKSYFEECFGMEFEAYSLVISLIFVLIVQYGYFNRAMVVSLSVPKQILDQLDQLLAAYSRSLAELSQEVQVNKKYSSRRPWHAFNILRDYPLVRIGDRYIAPILNYLRAKTTDHIYYALFEHYVKKERSANPKNGNPARNEFTESFGKGLESLILEFARLQISPKYAILPEFRYPTRTLGKSSADLHLYAHQTLYLIQVKNKRTVIRAQAGDMEAYKSDLENMHLYAYEQNLILINDTEFRASLQDRLSADAKISNFVSIVIYPDGFDATRIVPISKFLIDRCVELDANYGFPLSQHNAFMSLSSFLQLLEHCMITKRKISKIIGNFHSVSQRQIEKRKSMKFGMLETFDDYILAKTSSYRRDATLVRQIYWEFFDMVVKIAKDNMDPNRISLD